MKKIRQNDLIFDRKSNFKLSRKMKILVISSEVEKCILKWALTSLSLTGNGFVFMLKSDCIATK